MIAINTNDRKVLLEVDASWLSCTHIYIYIALDTYNLYTLSIVNYGHLHTQLYIANSHIHCHTHIHYHFIHTYIYCQFIDTHTLPIHTKHSYTYIAHSHNTFTHTYAIHTHIHTASTHHSYLGNWGEVPCPGEHRASQVTRTLELRSSKSDALTTRLPRPRWELLQKSLNVAERPSLANPLECHH